MNDKGILQPVVMTILLLIILIGAGVYLFSPSSKKNLTMFSNNYYSFQYPGNYFAYKDTYTEYSVYLAPQAGNGADAGSPLGLNKSEDIWVDASVFTNVSGSVEDFMNLSINGDYYNNVPKIPFAINKGQGYKLLLNHPTGKDPIYADIGIVKKEDKIYRLSLNSYDKELLVSKEAVFNEMLDTFILK